MAAVLIDLYETMVWMDWEAVGSTLTARWGVDFDTLLRAFQITSRARSTGRLGSAAGNLGALAEACGARPNREACEGLALELDAMVRRSVHLYDDVLPALRELRAAGHRVAMVSNCDHATAAVVDALDLAREMDAVVLSFEVGSVKPEARIFQEALDRLGAPAEGSVFIDDQGPFLDGAAALGIRAVRIVRGPHEGALDLCPYPAITDFRDLSRYVAEGAPFRTTPRSA